MASQDELLSHLKVSPDQPASLSTVLSRFIHYACVTAAVYRGIMGMIIT